MNDINNIFHEVLVLVETQEWEFTKCNLKKGLSVVSFEVLSDQELDAIHRRPPVVPGPRVIWADSIPAEEGRAFHRLLWEPQDC